MVSAGLDSALVRVQPPLRLRLVNWESGGMPGRPPPWKLTLPYQQRGQLPPGNCVNRHWLLLAFAGCCWLPLCNQVVAAPQHQQGPAAQSIVPGRDMDNGRSQLFQVAEHLLLLAQAPRASSASPPLQDHQGVAAGGGACP